MPILFVCLLLALLLPSQAQELNEASIRKILPAYSAYVEKARTEWGVPQVAVAVVYQDEILWWNGFGPKKPDLKTVFAIGSTTKAFAAATLAMMVDEGGPGWDARVVDHLPQFAMFDPWVTREVQVKDLLAQHLGLTPQALSALGAMGYSAERIRGALRWVEPVSSFRSTFAYLNSPHLVAGELVAKWAGAKSWEVVLEERILIPLGMNTTTWTAGGLDDNANSATGHARVEGKITPIPSGPFPYVFGPAGGLNSNLYDMARWIRLQLADGEFEGKRLVSGANLRVTRSPQTIMSDSMFYAMGWITMSLQHQRVIWHNGGTPGHVTFVGLQPEHDLGIVILSNLGDTRMPDAVGLKFFEMVHKIKGPDYSAVFLADRREPVLRPRVKSSVLEEMQGNYYHPALGSVVVGEGPTIRFSETGFEATLEPTSSHVFRMKGHGWVADIGWGPIGEALYLPASLSEPSALTIRLGDENQGAKFRLLKTPEATSGKS